MYTVYVYYTLYKLNSIRITEITTMWHMTLLLIRSEHQLHWLLIRKRVSCKIIQGYHYFQS